MDSFIPGLLHSTFPRSTYVVTCMDASFFLVNTIPLHGYSMFGLSTHRYFHYELVWTILLKNIMGRDGEEPEIMKIHCIKFLNHYDFSWCRFWCGHVFSLLWGRFLGTDGNSQNWTFCGAARLLSLSSVKRSGVSLPLTTLAIESF